MIIKTLFLFFLCFSFAKANDANKDNSFEWLKKMEQAMKMLNYQGTVAFMKNGKLDTMQYIHAAKDGLEQERLISLNTPMREVVRHNGKVICTYTQTNKRMVNHQPANRSFIMDLPDNLALMDQAYQVKLLGEESVAMRPAWVITIEAKDPYRYSRTIWLDKVKYLPLKIEVYDLGGNTLEQIVFTDLKVQPHIDFIHVDEQSEGADTQHLNQSQEAFFNTAAFSFNALPVGFKKVFSTNMDLQESKDKADHLLLSDGFSSVSVYLSHHDEDLENGLKSLGSVNSFSHVIGQYQVVVLGEVPAKTVEMIAKGVSFND